MALPALPAQRTLLLLSSRLTEPSPLIGRLRAAGWQVQHFPALDGLQRCLRHQENLVAAGLIDLREPHPSEAIERLAPILSLPHLAWVGMVDEAAMEDAGKRQLVRDCCFDFITLPCPEGVLDTVVGHAYGLAWLGRSQGDAPANSDGFAGMVGQSPQMRSLFRLLRKAGPSQAPVLIRGEPGTGKTLTAHALHQHSSRADMPFVTLDCSMIPPHLLHSELFGYPKGDPAAEEAAIQGRIERADGGTLFLDDIGALSLDSQAALMRLLEQGTLQRPGTGAPVSIDVRVISASQHDLDAAVSAGCFRSDLYHRLSAIQLQQPALRDRAEDIQPLAEHARQRFAREHGRRIKGFTPMALRQLNAHAWPGNVRELLNRVRQAVVMAEGRYIEATDLDINANDALPPLTLDEARADAERAAILTALRRNRQRIGESARELGVSRVTLYRLMNRHGMREAY